MACYLIHFLEPYHHAAHYLGWSPEVQARVNAHVNGHGARLTQVVHDAGIGMVWVRVWPNADRKEERRLKSWNNGGRLCPICCGQPVQMPLLGWMPAYVPEADQDSADDDQHDSPLPNGPDRFDYDAEAEDYEEDALDREFWRSGNW